MIENDWLQVCVHKLSIIKHTCMINLWLILIHGEKFLLQCFANEKLFDSKNTYYNKVLGENLYKASGYGNVDYGLNATKHWYSKIKDYNWGNPSFIKDSGLYYEKFNHYQIFHVHFLKLNFILLISLSY
jgi:hypothetical protein